MEIEQDNIERRIIIIVKKKKEAIGYAIRYCAFFKT